MKNKPIIILYLFLTLILISPTLSFAEVFYHGQGVNIPFSQPIDPASIQWAFTQGWPITPPSHYGQGQPRPASINMLAPFSGTAIIRLNVVRADWDAVGIYQTVPIGMSVYVYSPPIDKQGHVIWRDHSNWIVATGRVDIWVKNVKKGDTVHVYFSTLTPAGARGTLEIWKP